MSSGRSDWLSRLQRSRSRAEGSRRNLENSVNDRLSKGNIKDVYRDLRQLLGEEQVHKVANRGWNLQVAAMESGASAQSFGMESEFKSSSEDEWYGDPVARAARACAVSREYEGQQDRKRCYTGYDLDVMDTGAKRPCVSYPY
mmetsp:Transcript_7407/g.11887  ORF Transcript_7407/g.11887 Transcript_7407/m.11887 type:complete len:143 (+) Transcript_7407:19-447(+)